MDWQTPAASDPLSDLHKILREQAVQSSPVALSLSQAASLLELHARLKGFRGTLDACTVELADENEPDGLVIVRDRNGMCVASLPRAAWEAIAERCAK